MVTDASGTAVEWSIEMSAPSSLARQGWKPKLLKPGDQVAIAMHPLRDGQAGRFPGLGDTRRWDPDRRLANRRSSNKEPKSVAWLYSPPDEMAQPLPITK